MTTAAEIEEFERAIQATVDDCGMTPRCGGCQTCLRLAARTVEWEARPDRPALEHEFELGPVALLEAVAEWDVEAALNMRPDPGSWARLAWLIREAKRALDLAAQEVARNLAEVVPYSQPQEWEGVPVFTVRGGSTRKTWENDEVKRHAIARIADELGVTTRAVEEVINRWCEVATPSWKVTGLRTLGLDPDEYCQKSVGPPAVQFAD